MEKVIPRASIHRGFLTVEIHNEASEKKEICSFRSVRCGLSWPGANSPGFYVLVGQPTKRDIAGDYSLRFLREGEGQIPSELYERVANDLGAFNAEEIFADTSVNRKGYVSDFIAFKREKRPHQRIFLKPAPFYEDFAHGVYSIKGLVKKDMLTIPKESLVYEQLKNIATKDLKENPEEKFFAVNALRFVVGAFEVLSCSRSNLGDKPEGCVPPVGAFT